MRAAKRSTVGAHCRWRWCFVGGGAVWMMGVYFVLLGMEGENQAPLLATIKKY